MFEPPPSSCVRLEDYAFIGVLSLIFNLLTTLLPLKARPRWHLHSAQIVKQQNRSLVAAKEGLRNDDFVGRRFARTRRGSPPQWRQLPQQAPMRELSSLPSTSRSFSARPKGRGGSREANVKWTNYARQTT